MVRYLFLSAAFMLLTAVSSNAQLNNDMFARPIVGTKSITWGEYERLQNDVLICTKTAKPIPSCEALTEKLAQEAWNAIVHAVLVNATGSGQKFYNNSVRSIILEKKAYEGAAYAILLIDEQMKIAPNLYGRDPKTIYVSKIVYDALARESPCK